MRDYFVRGPYDIPTIRLPGAKRIDEDRLAAFWNTEDLPKLKDLAGCYVLGVRAGKGYKPWYAGIATRCLRQELFTPDKKDKINKMLAATLANTPVVFFVIPEKAQGAFPLKATRELEEFLIGLVRTKNPDALNKAGGRRSPFAIKGVWLTRGGGKPSNAAVKFRKLMNL